MAKAFRRRRSPLTSRHLLTRLSRRRGRRVHSKYHRAPHPWARRIVAAWRHLNVWAARGLVRRWRATTTRVRAVATAACRHLATASRWLHREMKDVVLCYSAVFTGVCGSMTLPSVLAAQLGWLPTTTPLPLLTLAVIAAVVCDSRALPTWRREGRQRLGDRVLRAFSAGVLWMLWWRKAGEASTRA